MSANILSPEERLKLSTIPAEISDSEFVRFFSLTPADPSVTDQRISPAYRFGQIAHICLLRWLGWSPVAIDRLPDTAACCPVQADGIGDPGGEFTFAERTSRFHTERARKFLSRSKYTSAIERLLAGWLEPLIEEQDRARMLLDLLCRHLY